MKKSFIDFRLIFGIILAHSLLLFSFSDKSIFWYIFTGSILILITYAMLKDDVDDQVSFLQYIFLGIVSGLLLYLLFWFGYQAIRILHLPFKQSINDLYRWFAPKLFWQYLALILIAAPGEELFWRGYVQKSLLKYFGPKTCIVIGALLYASVHLYSKTFMLVFAAFITGLIWGQLYMWKKSMPMVIVSHIVFDIMIFMILPLK